MATSTSKETPLMKQYNSIKAKYPNAILLFRVGDFYETFGEDAINTSKILGIVLTKRSNGAASHVELAGFPHHALDSYLSKLVRAGYRVAICDQLEDPKKTKKIVKRGVTELVTPGVTSDEHILDNKSNNFLASIYKDKKGIIGIAFLDISTGEFLISEGNKHYIDKLLQSFTPSEIIFPKSFLKEFATMFRIQTSTFSLEDWLYTIDYTQDILLKHFDTLSLKGFGIDKPSQSTIAAGAILHYLKQTEHTRVGHISRINRIESDKYVWLDPFSIRNLELRQYNKSHQTTSLLDVLDYTVSPMGARLLKKWIVWPLKDEKSIMKRQEVVSLFIDNPSCLSDLRIYLDKIGDIERLISKVPLGKVNPRALISIKEALKALVPIQSILVDMGNSRLKQMGQDIDICQTLIDHIDAQVRVDAPAIKAKGNIFKVGVSAKLDELRDMSQSGKSYIAEMQQREIERTGIPKLKVGFNNVFGYYLEVTHTHKDKVPTSWTRKQTLTNAERYITEELKDYEQKILSAQDKIHQIELDLFDKLVAYTAQYVSVILNNAQLLAQLDCLLSFAYTAHKNNYTKPVIDDSYILKIEQGRHPVIEQTLPAGQAYVPNDLYLHPDSQQIIVITGPNMSGKSAVLRQTALIVLMAQMGSYVPAHYAHIGWVDKIFTRVGASDNISLGESTFMVEMNETASIVNNFSARSLILLDEIGRGTSTYDGISIAWSIAEYIHNHPKAKPRTLFATHYHELNNLAQKFPRIKNYHVATKEIDGDVLFLRKLVEGGSAHSFGIHVAKLAGMPVEIVQKANELLSQLEDQKINTKTDKNKLCIFPDKQLLSSSSTSEEEAISISNLDARYKHIEMQLKAIDIDRTTPIEAMLILQELLKI